MRLLAIVDFHIPSLGMLDVLRHLQADRIPFTNPKINKEFDYNLRYICVRFALHLVSGFSEGVTKLSGGKICPSPLCVEMGFYADIS